MGAFDLQMSLAYLEARYRTDLTIEYVAVYLAGGREVRVPVSLKEGEELLRKIVETNQAPAAKEAEEPNGYYLGVPPPREPAPTPAPNLRVEDLPLDQPVPAHPSFLQAGKAVPRRTISQDSAGNPMPDDAEESDVPFSGGDDLESF